MKPILFHQMPDEALQQQLCQLAMAGVLSEDYSDYHNTFKLLPRPEGAQGYKFVLTEEEASLIVEKLGSHMGDITGCLRSIIDEHKAVEGTLLFLFSQPMLFFVLFFFFSFLFLSFLFFSFLFFSSFSGFKHFFLGMIISNLLSKQRQLKQSLTNRCCDSILPSQKTSNKTNPNMWWHPTDFSMHSLTRQMPKDWYGQPSINK